jgi:hypothetical protein
MQVESMKYRFAHRSFQEYFTAVFMSKQNDIFITKLAGFFDKRNVRTFSNSAFPMLFDMIPERVKQFVFVPFLTELFRKCDAKEGYFTFLEDMYPTIYYDHGEVMESTCNESESYIFEFIFNKLRYRYKSCPDDLPFVDEFVTETIMNDDISPVMSTNSDGKSVRLSWPYGFEPGEEPPEPEEVGWHLQFDVVDILKEREKYSEIIDILNDNNFQFKVEYNTAKEYLNTLNSQISKRQDDLSDLL